MSQEYLTNSAQQTQNLGKRLARKILAGKAKTKALPRKGAFVLALQGDLGGGKTTFLQGFAKGLGVKEKITSPTFVIMRNYKLKTINYKLFYHIDCYRIQGPKEILTLGFKDIAASPQNIIAIEWAERIENILPKDCLGVKFSFVGKTKRKITLKNFQF